MQDLNAFKQLEFLLLHIEWFHAELALKHSIHKQYYLIGKGFDLHCDFNLLDRKGLGSLSVQGNFHQKMRDALKHITEAHFCSLWKQFAQVDSILKLVCKTSAEWYTLATTIHNKFCLKFRYVKSLPQAC